MKKNIIFFAEIGKTNLSSKASEDLLLNLYSAIKKEDLINSVKLCCFPIFDKKNFFKWILYLGKKSFFSEGTTYLPSSSIKLIRDLIYIFYIIKVSNQEKSSNIIIYNLNKLQLNLLIKLRLLINSEISFIQADGFLLNKYQLSFFKKVYVFSRYIYEIYQKLNHSTSIQYCLPFISEIKEKNLNLTSQTFSRKSEIIYFIHCGSISEYNLSSSKLRKLGLFCMKNKKFNVLFTTNQKVVPLYFQKLLNEFSENFLYFNNINEKELIELLKKSHYGLELRDNKNSNSNIDFPSKLITYLNWQLPVISTFSNSIPVEFNKVLVNFDYLDNIKDDKHIAFGDDLFLEIKKFIKNKSLNKSIINI